jgi:hypothetical protein
MRGLLAEGPDGDRVNSLACHIKERLAGKNRNGWRWGYAVRILRQKLVIFRLALGIADHPLQWLLDETQRLVVFPHDMFREEFPAHGKLGEALAEAGPHGADFQALHIPVFIPG